MNDTPPIEHWGSLLFLGIFSFMLLYFAKRYSFFKVEHDRYEGGKRIYLWQLMAALLLFFVVPLFITPSSLKMLRHLGFHFSSQIWLLAFAQWLNAALLITAFCCLMFAFGKPLWREFFYPKRGLVTLIVTPLLTYLIALPLISFIDAICEIVSYWMFGVYGIDQEAIRFLKEVQQEKLPLMMAIFVIVCAAPFIEELLFRGFFQTYLRQRMGAWPAIALSSSLFALFHFAPSQGVGNFPLLITLFAFALFLGLTYEKTRSLLAPMGLHLLFNLVTVVRLLT